MTSDSCWAHAANTNPSRPSAATRLGKCSTHLARSQKALESTTISGALPSSSLNLPKPCTWNSISTGFGCSCSRLAFSGVAYPLISIYIGFPGMNVTELVLICSCSCRPECSSCQTILVSRSAPASCTASSMISAQHPTSCIISLHLYQVHRCPCIFRPKLWLLLGQCTVRIIPFRQHQKVLTWAMRSGGAPPSSCGQGPSGCTPISAWRANVKCVCLRKCRNDS